MDFITLQSKNSRGAAANFLNLTARLYRANVTEPRKISPFGRLCENTVHGSTRLTTNGVVSLEIEYLSVRLEHRRRAPREFSHSLSVEMTTGTSVRFSAPVLISLL